MGAAKALRLMGKRSVALTYFGEGCASEGDIPSALNIASVHGALTALTTPSRRQRAALASARARAPRRTSDGASPS